VNVEEIIILERYIQQSSFRNRKSPYLNGLVCANQVLFEQN